MAIHDKLMYGVTSEYELPPYQYRIGTALEVSIFTDDDNDDNKKTPSYDKHWQSTDNKQLRQSSSIKR